jgi:hypothetical protein
MSQASVSHKDLMAMYVALRRAETFLRRRDEMNAEVHCSAVRLSSLTECVIAAAKIAEDLAVVDAVPK